MFEGSEGRQIGVLSSDELSVIAVAAALPREGSHPSEVHRAVNGGDVVTLLRAGEEGMAAVRSLALRAPALPLPTVRLHPPIAHPPKVLGIGGNFANIFAGWSRKPEAPPVFWKSPTSIIGPGEAVVLPAGTKVIQPEPELVAIVGRHGRRIPADERAFDYVAGYTLGNDISNIDRMANDVVIRKRPDLAAFGFPTDVPFNLGMMFSTKSWDTFSPLGPWLVTPDELDLLNIRLEFRVNGEIVVTWRVAEMTFGIPDILAYISRVCTLEPGDVIFTGTPQLIPPLQPGDVLDHTGTGLGNLRVQCIAERLS